MATLTPVLGTTAGTVVPFVAATAGGDIVATNNTPGVTLTVRNASASAITATLTGVVPCSQGALHNVAVVCAAGVDTDIVVPGACINPATGNAAVGYSAVASVTVASFI